MLHVVVHTNMAANTVPSGHVQRAPYIQPYFCRILWSPVLWRPIRNEPNSARFESAQPDGCNVTHKEHNTFVAVAAYSTPRVPSSRSFAACQQTRDTAARKAAGCDGR